MSEVQEIKFARTAPARVERARGWQQSTPYAAMAWSLGYVATGLFWAVSG